LSAIDSPDGTLYRQHAIVSDFYTKSLIPRPLLRAMHRRAGEYYASEEPDIFRATAHLQRAGEHQRAARLVAADVWGLINAGKARGLCRLLADFKADQMETLDWVRVQIGLGIALALVGESEQAQFSYTSALAWLDELPAGDVEADVLKARACYGLGDLLRHEDPKAALAWLGRGLEMFTASQAADLRPAQRQERAALLIKMATVLVTQGDFARALAAVTEGMSLLPPGPRPLRVSALINLGSIAYFCGDREQGRETTRQGRDMSRQLHDTYRTAELLGDVAIDKEIAGDWEGAAADYASALSLAEQLGSIAQLARLSLDLGILKTKQGDNAAALELLENGLRMAQEHNLHHHEAAIRPSLADLHLRRGEAVLAAGLLPEAERLALKHKINTQLPDIYRVWAEVRLAQGAPGEALRYARSSLSSAREQGMKEEEGVSLRVLGATLLAQGEREAALEAFRESLALLVGAPVPRPIDVPEALDLQECADPYEAARTAARYGHALRSSDPIPGRALIEAARAEFARLGATRDLGEAQELLS
jgi:tetratricopeptide (TPR) repeat protein